MAFEVPKQEQRGWPSKALPYNPTLRLSAGLGEVYNALRVRQARMQTGAPAHHTLEDGRLWLAAEMPLLAHRYRYLRTLSESNLSQVICAIDTYRTHDADTEHVAIKMMNAQHWVLGAQEYERLRLLWRALSKEGCEAPIVRLRSYFEQGDHFCLVFDVLAALPVLFAPAEQAVGAGVSAAASTHAAPQTMGLYMPQVSGGGSAPSCGVGLGAPEHHYGNPAPQADPARLTLPLRSVRAAASQLLGALVFLHSQGVLHAGQPGVIPTPATE